MRELTLKYVIQLASNIGKTSQAEAKLLEDAQKHMQEATATTSKEMGKLVDQVGKTGRDVGQLNARLNELATNSSTRRQIDYMERLGQAIERNTMRAQRFAEVAAKGAEAYLPEMAGAAYGAGRAVSSPLRAFASLEQAQTALRVNMMNGKGDISPAYDAITKEAVKLGNELPGTTKDFVEAALALKKGGTPGNVIANGGLRASAYLGVLLDMNQAQAAEMVARTREAFGLPDNELVKTADLIQRTGSAFGLHGEDMQYATSQLGGLLGTLKLNGYEPMRQILAVEGMASQRNIRGTEFATHFGDFIKGAALMKTKMHGKGFESKEVNEIFARAHIKPISMFGSDGKVLPLDQIAERMEVFRKLKPAEQLETFHKLFGIGSDIASMLTEKGGKGVRDALALQDDQGSLNAKLAETTKTLTNTFEALTGTVENVAAQAATPLGKALKHPINAVNDWLSDSVQPALENHPALGTAGLAAMAIGGGLGASRGVGALRAFLAGRAGAGAGVAAEAATAAEIAEMGGGGMAGMAMLAQLKGLGRFANVLKFGGPAAMLSAGLDVVSVLSDDKLSDEGRSRGLWRAGATNLGGLLAGAAGGAAAGSVVPVVGTALGALVGGGLGYFGSGSLFDSMWKPSKRDYLSVTAPPGAAVTPGAGGAATVQIGEGKLQVDVHVHDDRVSAASSVVSPLALIKIDPGATNPGSFKR